jgi:hypothetical protein
MKTNTRFWSCLARFFLEWEMFQTKFVEKIKTHISWSITFFFFQKPRHLWDNVEKYWIAGQNTDDNMDTYIAYWIPKATNTHSQYVICFAFPLQQCCMNNITLYIPCLSCIYLGNKEIYCIFKTCCIISVLFSAKCHLFHNLAFCVQVTLIFYINHILKLKYHTGHFKVK